MIDEKSCTAKPATASPLTSPARSRASEMQVPAPGRCRSNTLFGSRSLTTRLLKRPVAATAALLLFLQAASFQSGAALAAPPAEAVQQPPSIEFGELYNAVEMAGIFPDQKTFADAVPRAAPAEIMAAYNKQKGETGFDLKSFVAAHFTSPAHNTAGDESRGQQTVAAYIASMWEELERKPDQVEPYSSLLPLGLPYIVPGGRFSEIYYWDSYFTMLGLEQGGRHDLSVNMLRNIAALIDRHGHMPNGNRSYYLSRSEPPFFACMVELIARRDGDEILVDYLPALQAEYHYWMEGATKLAPGAAHRHVLRLADGTLLNRYWDDRDVPRDESYREDIETAKRARAQVKQAPRPAAEIYRDLRAAGETGWDFSSRWLADGKTLATIRTTSIAPVDLNTLVMHLERVLAKAYQVKGDQDAARRYEKFADDRAAAIRRLMWDADAGLFTDYLWRDNRRSQAFSAATVFPLYFGVATQRQADAVAVALRRDFLQLGGLGTTRVVSGQQWDRPNGWAPLQYLAIEGLNAYGHADLASEIARRWLDRNIAAYEATGLLVEKYNVEQTPAQHKSGGGGGGEYPLQIGFGWTNGVLAKLMAQYPAHTAEALRQHAAD